MGWRAEPVTVGESGAQVFRLEQLGSAPRYLKLVPRRAGIDTTAEARRLAWLRGRLPVPEVIAFADEPAGSFLLMTTVAGLDAMDSAHAADPSRLVRLLAEGLRTVHALPMEDCPFDHRLDAEIARAEAQVRGGLVDEADFDEQRQDRSAAELLELVRLTRPRAEELVFTHGDYCLPNIMLEGGQVAGFVDLGAAGMGDRYRDLALAARSIERNLGEGWSALLFEEYGLNAPNAAKIEFFQLLDELF